MPTTLNLTEHSLAKKAEIHSTPGFHEVSIREAFSILIKSGAPAFILRPGAEEDTIVISSLSQDRRKQIEQKIKITQDGQYSLQDQNGKEVNTYITLAQLIEHFEQKPNINMPVNPSLINRALFTVKAAEIRATSGFQNVTGPQAADIFRQSKYPEFVLRPGSKPDTFSITYPYMESIEQASIEIAENGDYVLKNENGISHHSSITQLITSLGFSLPVRTLANPKFIDLNPPVVHAPGATIPQSILNMPVPLKLIGYAQTKEAEIRATPGFRAVSQVKAQDIFRTEQPDYLLRPGSRDNTLTLSYPFASGLSHHRIEIADNGDYILHDGNKVSQHHNLTHLIESLGFKTPVLARSEKMIDPQPGDKFRLR